MIQKYKIGDKIWKIKNNKAVQEVITAVGLMKNKQFKYGTEANDSYSSVSVYYEESELFLTKEDLIDSL